MASVSATDDLQTNETAIASENSNYQITSDLSNNDIQNLFDNAKEGDTFEFMDNEYKNISLVVDKKINIVSKKSSVVYADNHVSSKAQSLGIANTFGFYFTSNGGGSLLSGIKIIASGCDYGILVDSSDKTTIKDNVITGGKNAVLIKDSNGVNLINNDISKASMNGLQLHDVRNSVISKNTITYNGKSGIETSNIYYCNITNNTVHHNGYNGISMYNASTGNSIKYNDVHDNDNGIFINSTSSYDVINANSFTYNWNDIENYEIGGGSETGNGLLFGSGFKTAREGNPSRLEFKYNVLAHNQQYQAKNNPALSKFKLGDNWFDSSDDEDTFVCPFLLAGIMRMDTISVKNGIGLQMYDTQGNAVQEFGTFDTTVNINGNKYTAKFVNGKAIIDANLDPDKEYDVEVMIGGKPVTYKYKVASGDEGSNQDSQTSQSTNGQIGAGGSSSQTSTSASEGVAKGYGQNGTSNSAHYANSDQSGVHGTNASGTFQDSSDNGESPLTNGNVDAGDASEGEVSQEGKAYEIVPPSKISKEITDTSGLVVLSIVSVMLMLIYGYWRKEDYE
ncbi:MAG: right-handed parallel beta-helix repeat-containing protein [Methanobrevibacter sp.]|nr:right-handed parallel beta-helix repeat-containing protein [Methanobrevibacter sp.]